MSGHEIRHDLHRASTYDLITLGHILGDFRYGTIICSPNIDQIPVLWTIQIDALAV